MKILKMFFEILLFIIFVLLIKCRNKKFEFINEIDIDYPVDRFKFGTVILCLWLLLLALQIFLEITMNLSVPTITYFVLIIISIIYLCFGATPTVSSNKNEIILELDLINVGSVGMDIFGSWLGTYYNGIIIYDYMIIGDSIKIKTMNEDLIEFTGDLENIDKRIKVKLKSKRSIEWFKEMWIES